MCGGGAKNQYQPPPQIIDGSGAADDEVALRKRRAGQAAQFRTAGGRLGDTSSPSVNVKSLLGQ